MKKFLFSAGAVFASLSLVAQGITFESTSWSEVKSKAQQEGKFIFVDGYTPWCGPCKWMAKNIFPNDTAGQFYNKNFVNLKLDMEKGEGVEFAQNYQVNSYPSYLFFNSYGVLVHRSGGSKPLKDFIQDGENAINPEKQLVNYEKKFDKGNNDPAFLKEYGYALMAAGLSGDAVVKAYLKSAPEQEILSKEGFQFISGLSGPGSAGFDYVVKNNEAFKKVLNKDEVDDFIMGALYSIASTAGKRGNTEELTKLKKVTSEYAPARANELNTELEIAFYQAKGDFASVYKVLPAYLEKYKMNKPGELNNYSWYVFENTDEKAKLETAASWAKKSVSLDPNYYNSDTYANILFKIGKYAEAQKWAEKAIEYAQKEGGDAPETEALLAKIKEKTKK